MFEFKSPEQIVIDEFPGLRDQLNQCVEALKSGLPLPEWQPIRALVSCGSKVGFLMINGVTSLIMDNQGFRGAFISIHWFGQELNSALIGRLTEDYLSWGFDDEGIRLI